MGTTAEKLAHTQQCKEAIRQAIVEMGQTCGNDVPLSEYGEKILAIESGVDTSNDTVTADKMLNGTTAHNATGEQITGTIKTVTPSKSGNVVTVPQGYIAKENKVTVGTAIAAKTYTPGTSDQTIAADRYLTGVQTIKGDANFIEENIADGVTLFGKVGTHKGGGGLMDMMLVKSYIPAYSQISSFVMSGMINDSDNSGYNLTPANGTYKVTTETASKPPLERIYKHTSQNYYVYYIPESADGMYYSYGWAISQSIVYDPWSVLMMTSAKELTEGTSNWSGEMNMLYMPVTISDIVQSEIPENIVGRKVTAYNPATLQYTFDSEDVAVTGYEYEPQEHSVYLCNGTSLIGEPVGNEGGSHLYCYIPWRGDTPYGKSYDPREGNNYYHYATAWKYPSMSMYNDQIGQYHIYTIDGVTCSGSLDDGVRMQSSSDLYDKFRTNNRLWAIPPDANRKWSAGAAFNKGGQSKKQRMLWIRVANVATMHIEADWTASTPKITVYKDDAAVITYTNSGLSSGWHHAVLTYDYDTKMFILYVDGVKRGEYSFVFERSRYFDTFLFGSGHPDGNGGYMIGYVCEIKLWDIPLTAEMVSAEYQRIVSTFQ